MDAIIFSAKNRLENRAHEYAKINNIKIFLFIFFTSLFTSLIKF